MFLEQFAHPSTGVACVDALKLFPGPRTLGRRLHDCQDVALQQAPYEQAALSLSLQLKPMPDDELPNSPAWLRLHQHVHMRCKSAAQKSLSREENLSYNC